MMMYLISLVWALDPWSVHPLTVHPAVLRARAEFLRREKIRRANRMTIPAFAEVAHKSARKAGRATSTLKRIALALERFAEFYGEYRPRQEPTLRDLNSEQILSAYFDWLCARFGPSAARNLADAIGGVLKRAQSEGLIACRRMPRFRPSRSRSRKRPATPTHVALLLGYEAVRHLRSAKPSEGVTPLCTAAMLILVILLAGLRPGEAVGLMLQDIDLKNGFIHVRDNQHRCLIRTAYAERAVPIPRVLRVMLRRYLRRVECESDSALLFAKDGSSGQKMITRPTDLIRSFAKGYTTEEVSAFGLTLCHRELRNDHLLSFRFPYSFATYAAAIIHRDLGLSYRVWGRRVDIDLDPAKPGPVEEFAASRRSMPLRDIDPDSRWRWDEAYAARADLPDSARQAIEDAIVTDRDTLRAAA